LSIMGVHSPCIQAIGAPAIDFGVYSTSGYTLRHSGQVNAAVYDAKLIFHWILPKWNVRFDDRAFNCRSLPANEMLDCIGCYVFCSINSQVHYVQQQMHCIFNVIKHLPMNTEIH